MLLWARTISNECAFMFHSSKAAEHLAISQSAQRIYTDVAAAHAAIKKALSASSSAGWDNDGNLI